MIKTREIKYQEYLTLQSRVQHMKVDKKQKWIVFSNSYYLGFHMGGWFGYGSLFFIELNTYHNGI